MEKWKYDYYVEQLHRTAYKKHECFVLSSLFHDPMLAELKPVTQHHVRLTNSYALLDLYYPQLNFAIEVDEAYHEKRLENDLSRQQEIELKESCQFFRIKISKEGSPFSQVEQLKSQLIDGINEAKEQQRWVPWAKPQHLSFSAAKAEYSSTLFVKIMGDIPPDELLARQTGYWLIAEEKVGEIKHIVVVHNDMVSAVFAVSPANWHEKNFKTLKRNLTKRGHSGIPIIDSPLLGNQVTDWKTRGTIAYSNDVARSHPGK